MTQNKRHIGPDRGRCFEDFALGDVFEHWPGRTITESDNVWFTNLTMNTHPIHFDVEVARESEFGRPLVNSTLTLALITGLSVRDTSQNAVANLGWEKIELTAPVFVGDTLYAQSEVTAARPSKSRPHQGIVTVVTRGFNQRREKVLEMTRSFLVPRRPTQ